MEWPPPPGEAPMGSARRRRERGPKPMSIQVAELFFSWIHFLQVALLRKLRFSTPMIPTKLTAMPTSTMTMRPLTLDTAPRLATLIKKPSNVTTIPAIIISSSPRSRFSPRLFVLVLPGLALHEEKGRDAEQHQRAYCE